MIGGCVLSQSNRGMALENLIVYTNRVYKNKGVALVDKVPTPWSVNYDRRINKVKNAYPTEKSTVDFVGISKGTGIAFDSKYTKEKTRFPLSNIKKHQVDYLKGFENQGGVAFFIVHFDHYGETFFLPINKLLEWWEQKDKGGRKSIPYKWFALNIDKIKSGYGVPLNYLRNVKEFEGKF